jgi:hypothetical protein
MTAILERYPAPTVMVDLRRTASQQHVYGERPWASITGICLHQTACLLGERSARWNSLGAHFGVMRSGDVVWCHDLDKLVAHGNGWNSGTVGVELDGLYAGIQGDRSTIWDDPSTASREKAHMLTAEMIVEAKMLIRWICSEVAAQGGQIRALVAHRQSSKNRRNDPGSAIWKNIALPLHEELGLSDGGIGFTLGEGQAIPEAWDPRCKGSKY